MKNDMMIEAGVSIECQDCGNRTTVPALKVVPGAKCDHCGKELVIDRNAIAAKNVMLKAAASRVDVKVD